MSRLGRLVSLMIALLLLVEPFSLAAAELFRQHAAHEDVQATLLVDGDTVEYDDAGDPRFTQVDQLRCRLEVTAPEDARLIFAALGPHYGTFLLVEQGEPRQRLTDTGVVVTHLEWRIEPLQAGENSLPELRFAVELVDGRKVELLLPAITMLVHSSLDGDEAADILPPIAKEVEPPFVWQPWAYGLMALVFVIALGWFWKGRRRQVPLVSPVQQAQAELALVRGCQAPQVAEAAALSLLLRRYVDGQYGLHTVGQTVEEIGPVLATTRLEAGHQQMVLEVLSQCEKWQFSPGAVEGDEFTNFVKKIEALLAHAVPEKEDKTCGRW